MPLNQFLTLFSRQANNPERHLNFMSKLTQPGEHERELEKILAGPNTFDGDTPVFDYPLYCLVFTNRCGSNLFAEYLRQTPVFNGFGELLNHPSIEKHKADEGFETLPDYLDLLDRKYRKNKAMFGLKASIEQLAMLYRLNIHAMYKGGIKVIHMRRNDLVGQAVSLQIARHTKQWTSEAKAVQPPTSAVFSEEDLTMTVQSLAESFAATIIFCQCFVIPRIEISYEQVKTRPDISLKAVARFCGRPDAQWLPKPPKLKKQGDAVNERRRALYADHVRRSVLR